MENQTQLNQERKELLEKLGGAVPDFVAAEFELTEMAYADGMLSAKVKRLMAMVMAVKIGCTNCILAQTELAIEQGASKEEILESLQVVVAMGGTTGIGESLRVIKFLDEKGML